MSRMHHHALLDPLNRRDRQGLGHALVLGQGHVHRRNQVVTTRKPRVRREILTPVSLPLFSLYSAQHMQIAVVGAMATIMDLMFAIEHIWNCYSIFVKIKCLSKFQILCTYTYIQFSSH